MTQLEKPLSAIILLNLSVSCRDQDSSNLIPLFSDSTSTWELETFFYLSKLRIGWFIYLGAPWLLRSQIYNSSPNLSSEHITLISSCLLEILTKKYLRLEVDNIECLIPYHHIQTCTYTQNMPPTVFLISKVISIHQILAVSQAENLGVITDSPLSFISRIQ